MKKLLEDFIEPSHAAESSRQRNFGHRHSGFVNKLLGKKHASRLGHRNRGGSQMLLEQSPQLPLTQTKAFRQCFYACAHAIQSAIGEESQRP